VRVEQEAFLDQLEEVLGKGRRKSTEFRLESIKKSLHATFVALPKTTGGRLSQTAARYAVHRLFVQRHGWHVNGVAPTGESWSPTTSALGFGDHLPPRLRNLVEEQLGSDDFDLDELALLAATIEALIHSEAVGRLYATYKVFETELEVNLTQQGAVDMVYSCLTAYLTGANISNSTRQELEATREDVEKDFPAWVQTKNLIGDTLTKLAPNLSEYEFSDVERTLESVSEKMGHRVDEGACQELEDRLIAIEDGNGTGRVRLSDFYTSSLNGSNPEFNERPEFLRQLGILDESDPSVPRIMIPNYLTMQANCLNVSQYYDLCCIDLCEDIMDTLERHIQAPSAMPAEIIRILNQTDTAYFKAGRVWSDAILNKLDHVAEHHGGEVPLHGRLFAQWMHFAYPNECPYPHLSGATKLVSNHAWLEQTGRSSSASKEEMHSLINATPRTSGVAACDDSEEGMCLWAPEEELVDPVNWPAVLPAAGIALEQSPRHGVRAVLRLCAFLAMLGSSLVVMRNVLQQMRATSREAGGLDAALCKLFRPQLKDSGLCV